MLVVNIPFGDSKIIATIPNCIGISEPMYVKPSKSQEEAIHKAVLTPIGTRKLSEIAREKTTAAIVIDDLTRPCPTKIMVEEILKELHLGGIKDENIALVVATGNHRAMTEQEFEMILGTKICSKLKHINHNCLDSSSLKYYGITKMGVPVYVNKVVAEADVKITTGLITPHQGAGFSGGRKSIIPGISGLETLHIHHSFPIRSFEPSMGRIHGNPFHEEALEGAKMVGVDFILNVVTNLNNEVMYAVAGDIEEAFYAGVKLSRRLWEVPIERLADVVITSPGGYPRDIDLHQAEKAVASAELAIKESGIIILVAECRDGIGKFGEWLKEAESPSDVIERFKREGFTQEASSKAFMYARAMSKHKLIIVNKSIAKEELRSMFFIPAESIDEAIQIALKEKGNEAEFLVMPHGSEIIPKVKGVKIDE